jgi:4-amino-4-deoxy-L-arabinose transferase-like glycosyltransferase
MNDWKNTVKGATLPTTTHGFVRSPVWMVLVALVARVLYIVIAHSYRFDASHWLTFEMANLGHSLATGHGFSSPFWGETGPSAWTPPLYPWVISLAFRAFGIYSHSAAFAILLFNSVFSALTSWTIYRIARRVFNETVAVWSGWVWALLPYSVYWAVVWIWETSLSAFLLSLLFMLTLEMEDNGRLSSWFGYGLLWGIAGLINTAVLAWLPFSGCWLAYQLHRRGKRFVVPAVLGALVFWATLSPWLARNYLVFDKPLLVRGDLGVELRIGNNPEAEGWGVLTYHPGSNRFLNEQYKQMGEAAYDDEQADLAKEWIAQHPKLFLTLSFRRFIFFWAGIPRGGLEQVKNLLFLASSLLAIGGLLLAAKRRVQGVFLFATLLGFYPLIYYFTFPTPRYRHAIDPELVILAVFLISSFPAFQRRRQSAVTSGHDASEEPALAGRLLRWITTNVAMLILLVAVVLAAVALTMWNNNYSLHRTSRAEFSSQLDHAIDTSTQWIVQHPEIQENPALMFMLGDMQEMSGDPRLHSYVESYLSGKRVRVPGEPITWYYARMADPRSPVPMLLVADQGNIVWEDRWCAYATAPNRVELTAADRADMFSATKYSWGTRLHIQLFTLDIYRRFNGPSPELDRAINPVTEGVAHDAYWDFRVNDSYYQRSAFIFGAGRPDLVRRRWIERMLDYQRPDGSWATCWYGWCRGVFQFSLGKGDPGHSTVQAAWALYMLKYRYPQWIEQHYR